MRCSYSPWSQNLVDESTEIVFAVTCPVAWDRLTRAQYKRQVEVAATQAGIDQHETAYRGKFGCLSGVDDDMEDYKHLIHVNLYTEPEAAARWILARLRRRELRELCNTVVIVNDIGGGTADLVPYLVSSTGNSFERLEDPIGEDCGSHMLNERFEKLLLSKLAAQRAHLEQLHGRRLEKLVSDVAEEFENDKASLYLEDILSPDTNEPILFRIIGYMRDNVVRISRAELNAHVFQPWLERNAQLMRRGLDSVVGTGFRTVAICLIGGGADQPMLQPYLQRQVVDPMKERFTAEIRFMEPRVVRESGTFVARGAILAAGNTGTITGWEAQINFGMLRQVCYADLDAETAHALRDIPRERDPHSEGFAELIKNVPTWIIRQGEKYTSSFEFAEVDSVHVFYGNTAKWPLDETFVALVGDAQEHLPISHAANHNHRIVQAINGQDEDVKTKLKEAGICGRPWPLKKGNYGGAHGKRRVRMTKQYTVHTKVRCKMEGTDLVVTSEWEAPDGTKVTLAQRTLNIAESFSIERIGCYEDRGLYRGPVL